MGYTLSVLEPIAKVAVVASEAKQPRSIGNKNLEISCA